MTKLKNLTSWFKNNRETVIRTSYVIPILIAAGISVYHVVSWYGIMNPLSWAIYLSIGVEIAALSALAGMTTKMNKFVYVPFFIVTLIQLIGNVFATFEYININDSSFKDWILLTGPIFDSIGAVDEGDVLGHRRFLAILGGTFIPVISLSFLHMLVSFNEKNPKEKKEEEKSEEKLEEKLEDVKKSLIPETESVLPLENDFIEEEVDEVITPDKLEISEPIIEDYKENFEEFVEKKKRKLEEDRKIFMPLLELFYKSGSIKSGDVMPTYPEFKEIVKEKSYTDDNVKMFLTLCNYLEITELSDNIRKSKVDYESAKNIMNQYLTLDESKNDNQTPKDWWNKK